jgi:hypothetical protein
VERVRIGYLYASIVAMQ